MNPPRRKERREAFGGAARIVPQRGTAASSRQEDPQPAPLTTQVTDEIIGELLDPALWQPGLKQYALATNVAVQMFHADGKPIGECLNPQPVWSLLQPAAAGCAFGRYPDTCTCFAKALEQRKVVFAGDHAGLAHFAVPLLLEQRALGCLLAGQVFDRYPQTLSMYREARESGLPPQQVWDLARRAQPIATVTLRVYADLLTTLANALLQARYKSILEAQRMEQLRGAQKLESIGILAGGVAHDFNNLLTGILGNASLIRDEVPVGDLTHTRAQGICDAAHRAAGLTRQLLAYSGRGTLVTKLLDLSALVEDMSDLLRLSVSKRVSLQFELADNLPAIEADSSQVEQVVMNLVINGAEAMGSDNPGNVLVRTDVRDLDSARIQRADAPKIEPGRYVFLEVEDTGSGMDETTLGRIFDPFFTTKFTGRGLGLAALSGIVRGHKGIVEVRSKPGQGTVFRVLFPASGKAAPTARPLSESVTHQGSGTILVIDDEAIVRHVAKAALEGSGYTVMLAESGEAAIDLFQNAGDGIAAVILDMTMPGLSGYDTFVQLKRIRSGAKVLLSSGYDEMEARQRFSGLRLAGFLQKPYTTAALVEKIKAALSIDE